MNRILSLIFFLLVCCKSFSQSFEEKYNLLSKRNDSTEIVRLFKLWQQQNPDDPQLYVSAINFYFKRCREEIVFLGEKAPNNGGFVLTDSSGKTVGFLGSQLNFNRELLTEAISYANKGIEKFPQRLDIRFGKCYILQQIEDYTNFTNEVIKAINYSVTINNKWLWKNNEQLKDGETFFLETVYDYQRELYETENDSLLSKIGLIGEEAIKHYPGNVQILSITAVSNLLLKNYEKAIEYLKKAEAINPKDFIVLNNLAQAYKMTGDKTTSIKYYELVVKYGDERARREAREKIKQLKKE